MVVAAAAAAGEPLVPEPLAREALGYVGADPDAETVQLYLAALPMAAAYPRSTPPPPEVKP